MTRQEAKTMAKNLVCPALTRSILVFGVVIVTDHTNRDEKVYELREAVVKFLLKDRK